MKRLYRSKSNKMVGGVCYGMANHFDVDPAITRLLAVFLGFMSFGLFVLLYLFFWVIIPEEPIKSEYNAQQNFNDMNSSYENSNRDSFDIPNVNIEKNTSHKSKNTLAIFLIIIGVIAMLDNILPQEIFRFEYIFPAFLIFAGILMIFQGSVKNESK